MPSADLNALDMIDHAAKLLRDLLAELIADGHCGYEIGGDVTVHVLYPNEPRVIIDRSGCHAASSAS